MSWDTLAEMYERTMGRIEQSARACYKVELLWECEVDEKILSRHPELKTRPLVRNSPMNTRNAMYGIQT